MKPKSERTELRNNYINGIFNAENSNFENTNNCLINKNPGLLLNKKIVKIAPNNLATKNNSVQLKNNIIIDEENIDKNEWTKNRLKITKNMQERKIIYRLESDNGNNKIINILSAYKDKGFYVIYNYINGKNNYDKEIKATIKWNLLSNHFKIFDSNNNIL